MKKMFLYFWFVLAFGFFAGKLHAQPDRIGALQAALAHSEIARDSLLHVRDAQHAQVQRLSQRVDSLKQSHAGGVARGDLEDALQNSLHLVMALEQTFARLDTMQETIAQQRDRLRAAYDLAIRDRIARLNPADTAQVAALKRLQAARDALPEPAFGLAMPIPHVVIRPEDGLEAVRQKTELMSDIAGQVRREIAATDGRLRKLEEERRLRTRVQQFSQELFLFDEGASEGRSVAIEAKRVSGEEEDVKGGFETTEVAFPDAPTLTPGAAPSGPDISTGREVSLGAMEPLAPMPGEDALTFEIRQLRVRREALAHREAQVRLRAEQLRNVLEEMRGPAP